MKLSKLSVSTAARSPRFLEELLFVRANRLSSLAAERLLNLSRRGWRQVMAGPHDVPWESMGGGRKYGNPWENGGKNMNKWEVHLGK